MSYGELLSEVSGEGHSIDVAGRVDAKIYKGSAGGVTVVYTQVGIEDRDNSDYDDRDDLLQHTHALVQQQLDELGVLEGEYAIEWTN